MEDLFALARWRCCQGGGKSGTITRPWGSLRAFRQESKWVEDVHVFYLEQVPLAVLFTVFTSCSEKQLVHVTLFVLSSGQVLQYLVGMMSACYEGAGFISSDGLHAEAAPRFIELNSMFERQAGGEPSPSIPLALTTSNRLRSPANQAHATVRARGGGAGASTLSEEARLALSEETRLELEKLPEAVQQELVQEAIRATPRTTKGSVRHGEKPSQLPPPIEKIKKLVEAGTVVPDEKAGPYAFDMYHSNIVGVDRGYKNQGGDAAWNDENQSRFANEMDWATVDFEKNGVDPDWMFSYGTIGGAGVDMQKLRPTVKAAQDDMVKGYGAAYDKACAQPGAAAAFDRIKALEELPQKKVSQPGGTSLTIVGLYKGALSALLPLWLFGVEAVEASGEAGVLLEWRVKKARRIFFKLGTKYKGDVSQVTDCAAISLVFTSAEGLERTAKWVGERASTFKNRLQHPTDEGYMDLMFTVTIGGHVCEVQLHLKEMMDAKKSGAGHKMYKVCRRVLAAPIVEKETYCRAIEKKQPVGEGERNADGEEEGRGVMVYASGDVYEGQWRAGRKEGEGTYRFATGDVYEGQWRADKKEGEGTLRYATGDVYEGQYKAGKREGQGTYRYADGNVYEGQWMAGKKEGQGTLRFADGRVYEGQFKAGQPQQ